MLTTASTASLGRPIGHVLRALLSLLLTLGFPLASAWADCATRDCPCAVRVKSKDSQASGPTLKSRCHCVCTVDACETVPPIEQAISTPSATDQSCLTPPEETPFATTLDLVPLTATRALARPLPVPRLFVLHVALIR